MKKVSYLLMAAAIVMLPSCAKIAEEDNAETLPQGKTITITATIDNGDGTKTMYEEDEVNKKAVLNWIEGDKIYLVVYNNDSKEAGYYTCTAQESGPSVPFTLGDDLSTHTRSGFAIYPTLTLGGDNDNGYTVTLPAQYTVSGTDLTQVKVPMIGTVDPYNEKEYSFSAAVGVLKVTLTNVPVTARKLVVTAPDSDNLSGVFPLDAGSGYLMSAATGEVGHSITVNFDQQAAGATAEVYVPVPVGSLSAGTTFSVQQSDGTPIKTLTAQVAIPVAKGKLLPLAAFPVEDWVSLGTGQFIDNHTFYQAAYFSGAQNLTAETYLDVEIQQNASSPDSYRLVNPYGPLFEDPINAEHFGTGPNAYLYFTIDSSWGTDVVKNDSFHTGIKEYGGYYGNNELWFDNPGWGYTDIFQNNRIIKKDGSGNPLNIQLAPYYMGTAGYEVDCSTNPKIEIVFPESTPMLLFNYANSTASYSAGMVSVTMGSIDVTAVKVTAAASFSEGVEALLAGSGTILNFTTSGTQALALPDGTYCLVYKMETDGHGFVFKNGGTFSVSSLTEIPLEASMISVNIDAGTKDGSDHYDGAGKDALVDGNTATFWHTPWELRDDTYYNWSDLDPTYGAYIDIDLGSGKSVTSFEIQACLRNAYSDWPKHVIVYSKADGGSWNKVGEADDAEGSAGAGYWIAPIECTGSNARFIRISIISNSSDQDLRDPSAQGCTHLAELKLFGTLYDNGQAVDPWLNIFTDLSYSELKAGVTASDIEAMYGIAPYYLAENVAMPLLSDTYDAREKAFRIHSYEPYSDNRVTPAVLFTRQYSAMDNPTGIRVSSGDRLLVCVDQIPAGQSVSLSVYGEWTNTARAEYLHEPNFGGSETEESWNQNAVLEAGINVIDITADGMAYIMNTVTQADIYHPSTTAISAFKPVKVHFLPGCGTVEGYYDPSIHSDAFAAEILAGYQYKYFMVKGRKCLFLFHTEPLQSNYTIAEIKSGINTWDNTVQAQQDLSGLSGKTWFNNHITAITSTLPGAYMDATHRRVCFSYNSGNEEQDALHRIISQEALLENEGGWGPFHELGHIHQNAINWRSTFESSNNLFSNYCKKLLAEDAGETFVSRGSRIHDLAESYAAGKPWVTIGEANYQSEDTELHMRMNWQLWNYYHNCGHNTQFWPDLFEYLRQHPMHNDYAYYYHGIGPENPGLAQLEFYEACCEVAQEDLTDFFDAWGFFRTVSIPEYYQYATVDYTVTQSMIDESKARVAAKVYTKAAPFQYLEDRTSVSGDYYSQMGYYTQFIGAAATVSDPRYGSYTSDSAIFFNNNNAVAVELREGSTSDGALLYFTNMNSIILPAGLSFDGNSLWAVQADGVRVKMTEI